jgi:hypothetical protein
MRRNRSDAWKKKKASEPAKMTPTSKMTENIRNLTFVEESENVPLIGGDWPVFI